jgi:hypothetical protein
MDHLPTQGRAVLTKETKALRKAIEIVVGTSQGVNRIIFYGWRKLRWLGGW